MKSIPIAHRWAAQAAAILRESIQINGAARIIVASAPSQDELLAGLTSAEDIDWSRVTVFHMDEYVGLPSDHPATFRSYQQEHLLSKVTPAAFHGICGEASDPGQECKRYEALLLAAPIDLVCMGIGENGHIAFNDPPVANFSDSFAVKVVELDEACRRQQVNDECFPDFDAVPTHAITLTCPALMSGKTSSAWFPDRARRRRSPRHWSRRFPNPVLRPFFGNIHLPRSFSIHPLLRKSALEKSPPYLLRIPVRPPLLPISAGFNLS